MRDVDKAKLVFESLTPFSKLKDLVQYGSPEMIERFLTNNDIDIKALDDSGKNLLYYAISASNNENVKYLITKEPALTELKTVEGKNLLHIAILQGEKEIVNKLVSDTNIDKNHQDNKGFSPLHDAMLFSDHETIETLLKKEANPHLVNKEGETPLFTALNIHNKLNRFNEKIKFNIRRNMKKLIDYGVSFNSFNEEGKTPVMSSVESNSVDIIKMAIALKTDLNIKDISGNAAIHYAANDMNLNVVKMLVLNGADINLSDSKGLTAPLINAKKGFMQKDFIEFYTDPANGYHVNAQDNEGNTLLHYCVSKKQIGGDEVVKHLITHGGDTTIKNNQGQTPLDIAISEEIKTMIKKHMPEEKSVFEFSVPSANKILSKLSEKMHEKETDMELPNVMRGRLKA